MKYLNSYHRKNKAYWRLLALLIITNSSAQNLSEHLEEALANNPEIQSFELQYQISEAQIQEVETLPDTELGIAYFASETETRVGPQRFKVSAKQMLPWFGTIASRKNYKQALSETKYEEITLAKRKLIAAVSQSYYTLYALNEKQKILEQNNAVLTTYKTLLLTAVSTGKATAVSVLKIEIRQGEIQDMMVLNQQQLLSEQAHFNALLNRDFKEKVNPPKQLRLADTLLAKSNEKLSLHPELIIYDKLYESVVQLEGLNQKESRPKLGFGLDYIAVDERPGLNINDNGKDMIMPMLYLSIPIFNHKYKSKTQQNDLKQKEIAFQKQERFNRLKVTLEKAINNRRAAHLSYKTHLKNNKHTEEIIALLLKKYETATIDFSELLEVQDLQLKLKIKQNEAIHSFFNNSIIINYLIN